MIKTGKGLVEYAEGQLGRPYWWGTFGNIATRELLEYKKKQYPDVYNTVLYSNAEKQFGQRVHDCVGLIKGYRWSDGIDSTPKYVGYEDVNVTGLYLQCSKTGVASKIPEVPGTLVFMSDLSHVGVYIGNKEVIEAKGHLFGVVKTSMLTRTWDLWGQPDWIHYEDEPDIPVPSGEMPSLQIGSVGKAVKILQELLNYHGDLLEEDGEFGKLTQLAVKEWQADHGINPTGVCTKETWISLVS